MRILRALPLLLALAVVWALNHSFGTLPAIGKIIDPVNGAMAAAENVAEDWNRNLHLKDLRAPVQIWLDTSLIPHIRAGNDHDLYYAQGYIHATFRLWQMDLQTRAAGGRVSEVAGPKAIDFDRGMRREGMVWGAQHSLETMEREPRTKAMLDAYRDGINAYIHTLNYRALPIEYKLMGFVPEDWTNLRTALLMKYMARDLTGKTDDIAYTQLRDQLGQQEFDFLFPERIKGSKPVIPEGTKWDAPSMPRPEAPKGDVFAHFGEVPMHSSSFLKGNMLNNASVAFNAYNFPFYDNHFAQDVNNITAIDSNITTIVNGITGIVSRFDGFVSNIASIDIIANSATSSSMQGMPFAMHAMLPAMATNQAAFSAKRCETEATGTTIVTNYDAVNARSSETSGTCVPNASMSAWNEGEEAGSPPQVEGEAGIGSNNWAISGAHTASGKPILCNDPHLALNLPSLWYEMQLTAPGINAYGASLPGAPGIVIGFNEQISWGFTNNYRDVKDFYEIADGHTLGGRGMRAYRFCNRWYPYEQTIEVIKVKGGPDVIDTVLYTIHGPVTYDPSFPDPAKSGKLLACTWMGHRGSNELLATYLLNRTGDYAAFTDAISHFECPAQNIAYADGAGNIAMWAQGRFINKWKDQGKYVMKGTDSSTLWGESIPMAENPHVLNPPQGYVASANQTVTDSTYPYWYNQSYTEWRSWEINETFDEAFFLLKRNVVPAELMAMQNNTSSDLQYLVRPLSKKASYNQDVSFLLRNYDLEAPSLMATRFQTFWTILYKDIWQDDFPNSLKYPSSELTVQLLLSDSTSKYYDDKRTQQVETLRDIVQRAFKETTDSLEKLRHSTGLEWYKVKNTSLTHLAKIPAFSYDHLKIGGWSNTINAATGDHGPSWRMIVEMDSIPKAYAIYPGGQSGNPGSKHYGDFINQWVEGKYHAIQFLTAATTNPLKYTWTLTPD